MATLDVRMAPKVAPTRISSGVRVGRVTFETRLTNGRPEVARKDHSGRAMIW